MRAYDRYFMAGFRCRGIEKEDPSTAPAFGEASLGMTDERDCFTSFALTDTLVHNLWVIVREKMRLKPTACGVDSRKI